MFDKLVLKKYFNEMTDSVQSGFGNMSQSIDSLFKESNMGMIQEINEDGSLSVYFDMPGVKEEDLQIELTEDMLSISGARKANMSTSVTRKSLSVPQGFDGENLTAKLDLGVLCLTLSKKDILPVEVKKIALTK